MKPPLLVIDHVFHIKTKSFQFLFDILAVDFDLVVHYVDPIVPFSMPPALLRIDHVLICQLDFLTSFFIAHQKKVVVVPMYDGSAGLPDAHWTYNRQASYINFSITMHSIALKNGCRSKLVRYHPDVATSRAVTDFSTRRAFFWERLPHSSVNSARIGSVLRGEIDSIHVHRPRDDGRGSADDISEFFGCEFKESQWFEDRADLEKVLDSCNIFVAPRVAEGIGHAFLEAMAKGMVVIAYDLPTHNEYIANWHNGILFNAASDRIDLRDWDTLAARMGQTARTAMKNGHRAWLAQLRTLGDFILQTPRSIVPNSAFFIRFSRQTMADYQEGFDVYTARLADSPFPVQVASQWPKVVSPVDQQSVDNRLSDRGLNFIFGGSLYDDMLRSGWSKVELGHVWAIEPKSTVMLTGEDFADRSLRVIVEARALREKTLKVSCDGRDIGCAVIGLPMRYYVFGPITLDERQSTTLLFEVDSLDTAPPDDRSFAFMLRSIRLVPEDLPFESERIVRAEAASSGVT